MIKAGTTDSGVRVAIVGLTTQDLRELREGAGYRIKLSEVGMTGDLIIIWGATDQHIVDELARHKIRLPA